MKSPQIDDRRMEHGDGPEGSPTSNDPQADQYAARVDTARKAVAVATAICGVGVVVCANLRIRPLAALFAVGVGICVLSVLGFAVEYVVRTWKETRNPELGPNQFSLAGMFGLVTCAAVLFSTIKIFGGNAVWLVVVGVLAFASITELVRRGRDADRRGQETVTDRGESPCPELPGQPGADSFCPQDERTGCED